MSRINHTGRFASERAFARATAPLSGRFDELRGITPPPDIAAFLFDVDGVITDTARLHADAWRRLATEIDVPFDDDLADALRGQSRAASLARLLTGRNVDPATLESLAERKNQYYIASLAHLTPDDILPGIARLLPALRAQGIRLAAVSGSRNARRVLTQVGLIDAFDTIVDGADVTTGPRDRYVRAAALLRVDHHLCIVVEDAAAGIDAARALGMRTIGIGSPQRLPAATMVFESLRGVTPIALLRWLGQKAESHTAAPPLVAP